MRISVLVALCAASVVSGCASTSPMQPNVPTTETTAATSKQKEPDGFDKAGTVMAIGSRFVWSEAKAAWQWIDSDEHEAEVKRMAEVIKATAQGAYHSGVDCLHKKETCKLHSSP